MTKEMRPAHRIDVLSGALVYYGIQTKRKLGMYVRLIRECIIQMLCTIRTFTSHALGASSKNKKLS